MVSFLPLLQSIIKHYFYDPKPCVFAVDQSETGFRYNKKVCAHGKSPCVVMVKANYLKFKCRRSSPVCAD